MAERPSLGRDDSYNRVTVSRDLKSQIMSMIADSSESLPLNTVDESEEDESADKSKNAAAATNGPGSKLATESMSANDFATPRQEKPNPLEKPNLLEQVPTAKDSDGATASRATTATQESTSKMPNRPGMDKRQSTMKRISSAFKRTVSKNQ